MADITYATKVDGASGATGKVTAADMNEIKAAVNARQDGVFISEDFTSSGSTTVTLAHAYKTGTVRVFRNGLRLRTSAFTPATSTTITLTDAPDSGDIITVEYNY